MVTFMDMAVDELHIAFSDVPPPQHISGCPCCTDDVELQLLLKTAPGLLSRGQLCRFVRKALSTIGTSGDYLYFFPRIVELALEDQGWLESDS